jgi:hypothetical protein
MGFGFRMGRSVMNGGGSGLIAGIGSIGADGKEGGGAKDQG